MTAVISFEVSGPYGYFRIPYSTTAGVSYPFPPRTAAFGIISAVLGISRSEMWRGDLFEEGRVGIEVPSPPPTISIGANIPMIKEVIPGISRGRVRFPSDRMQFPRQVLKNPRYRIYYSGPRWAVEELWKLLSEGRRKFPIYLGSSEMLGKVSSPEKLICKNAEGEFETKCLIPVEYTEIEDDLPKYEIIPKEENVEEGGLKPVKVFFYRIPYKFSVKLLEGQEKERIPIGAVKVAMFEFKEVPAGPCRFLKAKGPHLVSEDGRRIVLWRSWPDREKA